ncbi:cytoskeleton protein RodZ [Nitrosospira multiformis ATCC 25196]|uniref:Cytoskeleton protein RodZ n=2 Tax=Nitrosospira multiformis (strain ATCC 25196 / NCIMB 11849 / C 71) TaxID=323848 RepID=A0A1H5W1R4_NITMU|nr:cytoskeleton protein RodZ [Nitrosospira multiformis ATCC 25196]
MRWGEGMEAPESSDIEQHEEPKKTGEQVGQVLRAARLERGLDIEDVARQLRFAARQVTALEEDEYDKLAGGPFLRGFVRNYAKLLQLDEAPLLKLLEQSVPPPTTHVGRPPSEEIPFPSGQEYLKRNVVLGGGIVLAITLLGYAIYSGDKASVANQPDMAMESEKDTGQPTLSFPFPSQAPPAEVPESQAPAPSALVPDMASQREPGIAALEETAPSADTGREQDTVASAPKDAAAGSGAEASAGEPLTLPLAPPPAVQTAPTAPAVPGGEPANVPVAPKPPQVTVAPKPSEGPVTSKPSGSAVTPKPPQVAVAPKPLEGPVTSQPSESAVTSKPPQVAVAPKPSEGAATSKPSESAVTPKPPQVAATPKPPPAKAGIRLTFAGESWVQVKDGNGKLLLSRVNPPGSEQVLRGKPPYSLMIGNPGQVKLVYNSKPVDLSIFAKLPGGMAHLVLQ